MSTRRRSTRHRRAISIAALALAGCGTNSFPEANEGFDFAGTLRWTKVDQRPDVSNALGIQAVSLAARVGDELHDPCAIELDDGSIALYYATASSGTIGRTEAAAGSFDWQRVATVLEASESWEEGRVGGPSVLRRNGAFELWYAGGDGAGIGRAVSSDGVHWSRQPSTPVLDPAESWELGGVRAPAVAQAPDGRLWMAYEAGDGSAVGVASSSDGIEWSRVDGSPSNGPTGAALERGRSGSWNEARVAAPALRIETTSLGRTVFHLWFEGMAGNDYSIGEAGSYDGALWTESPYDPVLAEVPPLGLTIGADEREPWVIGDTGARRLFFSTHQLDPPAQGIGVALDHSP